MTENLSLLPPAPPPLVPLPFLRALRWGVLWDCQGREGPELEPKPEAIAIERTRGAQVGMQGTIIYEIVRNRNIVGG